MIEDRGLAFICRFIDDGDSTKTETKKAAWFIDMATDKKVPEGFDWRAFTPEDSPKTPIDVMADPVHKDLASADIAVGDIAYDFSSVIYDFSDGTEINTGQFFHLSEAVKAKPVALIFGSYT